MAMKAPILAALFLSFASVLSAQERPTYADKDAVKHTQEVANVKGVVKSVYETSTGIVFINLGKKHPNQYFTAILTDRTLVQDPQDLVGKIATIMGRIELGQGSIPQITVNSKYQMRFEAPPDFLDRLDRFFGSK